MYFDFVKDNNFQKEFKHNPLFGHFQAIQTFASSEITKKNFCLKFVKSALENNHNNEQYLKWQTVGKDFTLCRKFMIKILPKK